MLAPCNARANAAQHVAVGLGLLAAISVVFLFLRFAGLLPSAIAVQRVADSVRALVGGTG